MFLGGGRLGLIADPGLFKRRSNQRLAVLGFLAHHRKLVVAALAFGQAVFRIRVDFREDLADSGGERRAGGEVGAELVQERGEFQAFVLGNCPFESRDMQLGDFRRRDHRQTHQGIQSALTAGDRMPAQAMLNDVRNEERIALGVFLDVLFRLTEVLFDERFEVEREVRFEHGLQCPFDLLGCPLRTGQIRQLFGELGDRSHPDFVPIKVGLLQACERFVGSLRTSVFEAAGIEKVFQDRAFNRGLRRLVMLLQHLVDFADQRGAIRNSHSGDHAGDRRRGGVDPADRRRATGVIASAPRTRPAGRC